MSSKITNPNLLHTFLIGHSNAYSLCPPGTYFPKGKHRPIKQWHLRGLENLHGFLIDILDLLYILSGEKKVKKEKKQGQGIFTSYFCLMKDHTEDVAGSHC